MPRTLLVSLGLVFAAGCAAKVPPAEAPLRPPETEEEIGPKTTERTDCDPIGLVDKDEKAAFKYDQRSIIEAQNLANEGFERLQRAEQRGVLKKDEEALVTQAVDDFITALLADPYNVHATYNLAAAYARIGRVQCSVNFLDRLASLRRLPSHTANVETKLDRLFGRGKYKNDLDPDFQRLRDDQRFRKVAEDLLQ